jgi:RNA polymerase sigma-70 factor (ECF subfamily)
VKQDSKSRAFETIISQNKGILYKVARSYSYCPEDQRDLIQEMTLQLWRSIDKYDDSYKLSTWIYRIAMNTAISFLRTDSTRKKHHVSSDAALFEEAEDSGSVELMLEIQRILQTLNKFDRAMLIMHLDGLDYAEISDVLNLSASNVGTRISRMKQNLNKEFNTR